MRWRAAPSPLPRLRAGHVHVWRSPLDGRGVGGPARTLSAAESLRAARFVRPADRARFVASRAFLRRVLGRYLGQPPQDVRFVSGPQGKPGVFPGGAAPALAFNLSHAGGWAVVGVARGASVGIDIEPTSAHVGLDDLAGVMSPREARAMRSCPPADQARALLILWTRKEAVVKGEGVGLGAALDRIDATRPAEGPDRVCVDGWAAPCWWLARAGPDAAHVGFLAASAPIVQVRYWDDVGRTGSRGHPRAMP